MRDLYYIPLSNAEFIRMKVLDWVAAASVTSLLWILGLVLTGVIK